MRRTFIVDLAFGLGIIVLLLAVLGAWRYVTRRSRDCVVTETALLSFYDSTSWNTDWTKGDFIIAEPGFSLLGRASFEDARDSLAKEVGTEDPQYSTLESTGVMEPGLGSEQSQPAEPLGGMELDSRIVLTATQRYRGAYAGSMSLSNKDGMVGTTRAVCSVSPPSYSGDHQFAIVRVSRIQWSTHTSEVTLVLQHGIEGWKVIFGSKTYYP